MSEAVLAPRVPIRNVAVDHDRSVVAFATLQLTCLIYLQKFALLSHSFPLSLPMLVLFISIGWMVLAGAMAIEPKRLAAWLVFLGFCLFSEVFNLGSISSLTLVMLLSSVMTVRATLSNESYHTILRRFGYMMILPACIAIIQYAMEMTIHAYPLNMDSMLPSAVLLQGYNYAGFYPWNSTFIRPQGFFFLEPSFMSAFTASAVIIEVTYFRRWWFALLMLVATFLSKGDTGIAMLVIAFPWLVIREKPRTMVMVIGCVVLGISGASVLGVSLPLLNRTHELQYDSSSGAERIVLPAEKLGQLVFDPSYLVMGVGAGQSEDARAKGGSIDSQVMKKGYSQHVVTLNSWPIVKIISEYGLLSMLAFCALYLIGISGNFNLPLKIALSVIYMFTGGYLLSPIMAELIIVLGFMFVPRDRLR